MGKIFDELEKQGCDIGEIKERFINDEEFYGMCLKKLVADENFEKLGAALLSEKCEDAFVCAHTLKGVISNMGLKQMQETIVTIVESLRAHRMDNLDPEYQKLLKELEDTKSLLD